jgi:glycosyltransferase involved in cell wall biosynthesis
MRIAVVADWFSEKMGYSENCLPKALASLGHEVHLVTSDAQIYFDTPTYKATYEPFIGPPLVPRGVKQHDGYTLHRLAIGRDHPLWRSGRYIKSLIPNLRSIKPDIVQTLDVDCQSTRDIALARRLIGCRLFLEAHTHASVYSKSGPPRNVVARAWAIFSAGLRHLASAASEKCYAISNDAAKVAVDHFGIEKEKIEVCSLGVDTDLFKPLDDSTRAARQTFRAELGFAESDVVCVYTGRLTEDKGPLVLARAIDRLVARGLPFRGLFVGNGTPADLERIRACAGCVIRPFVPFRDLPPYYLAADVGVWPKQESTSQLDAAASGLPLVISNRTDVPERIDGNGLTYEENDDADLAARLESLRDPELRRRMGQIGSVRIRERFSWRVLAEKRVRDYQISLER